MRLYLLASIATLSVVCADSQSSFLIETDTVSSFLHQIRVIIFQRL